MVRIRVLNNTLQNLYIAEKQGKSSLKAAAKFLTVMQMFDGRGFTTSSLYKNQGLLSQLHCLPNNIERVNRSLLERGCAFLGSGEKLHFLPICNQRRWLSTSVAELPAISDPDILKALRKLLAENWSEIPDEAKDSVEAALSKKTDDVTGQEELTNAWRAAEAVEKFAGNLIALRMALDELNGLSGQKVRPLPPTYVDALKAAYSKYNNYLAAFKPEEYYLKKKVEIELGSILVHIRQRCSGLGPEWGNVSLIGTSGLSGSFIEHREA